MPSQAHSLVKLPLSQADGAQTYKQREKAIRQVLPAPFKGSYTKS